MPTPLAPRASQSSSRAPRASPSSRARKVASAARRIQRAYRRFRRQFPKGGKLHSRSSPSPTIYQDDERLRGELSRLLQVELSRLAKLPPDGRDAEIAAALASGSLRMSPGMIRASLVPATGRVAFTGGNPARWAVEGFTEARERFPAVSDLTGAQLNYALLRVQLRDAPALAARVAGTSRARLVRPVAQRKSISPRHGAKVRELVWADPSDEVIVGAPGDPFTIPRDMRRFLGHALGDFSRYKWQMNPRRRRRVAVPRGGRVKRWIMHSNLGVTARTLYAWLRAMYAWRDKVSAHRNWDAIYPRPLLLDGPGSQGGRLGATLRDLLRRHVFALSGRGGARDRSLSAYAAAARAKGDESGAPAPRSSVGSFAGASRTRPRREPVARVRVAGIICASGHAGVFVLFARRFVRGWLLDVAILDPLGSVTFPAEVRDVFERELRASAEKLGVCDGGGCVFSVGAPVVGVSVRFVPVARALSVQYGSEGSCGPSCVSLLLSVLRELRRSPLAFGSGANSVRVISAGDIARPSFSNVSDLDVVVAAQLQHNGVL
jgi:hypothetical protein